MKPVFLLALAACTPEKPICPEGCETGTPPAETGGPSVDSARDETAETADTPVVETADTAETAEEARPLELCINEFMTDNDTALADSSGTYPDWIELHNPGAEAVSLAGWSMSDDPEDPEKSPLDRDLSIEAGGFLLLYADNAPELGADHLTFSLAQDSGSLGLYAPDGRGSLLDYAWIEADVSAARVPDCCAEGAACWDYVYAGTPGQTNGSGDTATP